MPFSGLLPPWPAQEEAGAEDGVTQRVRPGLERGTSVSHPQGGPWSSSHLIQPCCSPFSAAVPRELRMELAGRLAGSQKWSWLDRAGVEGPPGPGAPR